ncbi:D-2-hydroxyacid dehydrogenase [Mycolicibacterium sp.]|uniref:D-2-hydroxyacid dehydrogenase n=1 Tax=Mycolicibacterium sp. TaxID=2320850 RepID=UPI003D0E0DB1
MPKVVVLDGPAAPQLPEMDGVGTGAQIVRTVAEQFGSEVADADVVFVWDIESTVLRQPWITGTPVAWIHLNSSGVDAVMTDEVRSARVIVTNSRGAADRPVAEFVLHAILAHARDAVEFSRFQRRREWHLEGGRLIKGSRALVIGAGSIGSECAGLLKACGMDVWGVARRQRAVAAPFDALLTPGQLEMAAGWADYIVITAPLTDQTRGLVDLEFFRHVKPTAHLINVGRGPVVDEDALVWALDSGALDGATLDVFDVEPLPPSHRLWDIPNVRIWPHVASYVEELIPNLVSMFEDNLSRWTAGLPLKNVIDLESRHAGPEA